MMTQPTKAQILKWTRELRSGKYKQTKKNLETSDGFCCLGVACKIFVTKEKLKLNIDGYLDGALPAKLIQPEIPDWLESINDEFRTQTGHLLSALNDNGLYVDEDLITPSFTFDEIADLLEAVYIHEVLT